MTDRGGRDVYPYFDGPDRARSRRSSSVDSAILGRKHLVRVVPPARLPREPAPPLPGALHAGRQEPLLPRGGVPGAGVERGRGDRAARRDERRGPGDRRRDLLRGPDAASTRSRATRRTRARWSRRSSRRSTGRSASSTSPRETGVIGSSLGGVVSFYMAWEYPQVFGFAACMSSTFSYKDDLIDRVLTEPQARVEVLPRQRLARRQLRGHAGDGDGARRSAATACARTSCTSSSRSRSTTRAPGAGGCTCRCSSGSGTVTTTERRRVGA